MYNEIQQLSHQQEHSRKINTESSNFGERSVQNTMAETESKAKKLCTIQDIEDFTQEIKQRTVTECKSLEIGDVYRDMVSSIELLFYHILIRGIELNFLSLGDIYTDVSLSIPTLWKLESLRIGKINMGVDLEIFAQPEVTSFKIGDVHDNSRLSVKELPNLSDFSHGECCFTNRLNGINQKILEDLDRLAASNVPTVADFAETYLYNPNNQNTQAELNKRFAELMLQETSNQKG